jgi:WD40 repeat protein
VAVSPDGQWLATGSADRTVKLWDLKTAREVKTLSGHSEVVTALAFTPDSKQLVSAADDRTVRLWDVATGNEVKTIRDGPASEVPVMIVLPGGKEARLWVANRLIETYDLAQGKQAASWSGHDSDITSLAYSPDGEIAALGSADGTVRLWNANTKQRLKVADKEQDLKAHDEPLADLGITPDKKTLVTADQQGQVKIWDLAKGQALHTIAGKKQPVVSLAVSPDGKRFATATMDNVVRVYNVAQGKEERSWDLRVPTQKNRPFVRGLAFTPDGKQVATANANTTVYLLDCP